MNTVKVKNTIIILATLLPASLVSVQLSAQEMDHSLMSHDGEQTEQHMDHGKHSQSGTGAKTMDGSGMQHADSHNMPSVAGSGHGDHPAEPALQRLQALPPSGKSREANYDGSYMMHNTALDQSLQVRCALASRGLMMLDNDAWRACGGKPEGWSKGAETGHAQAKHGGHTRHQ